VKVCREQRTNVLTVPTSATLGPEAAAKFRQSARHRAAPKTPPPFFCVSPYISFDIDCIENAGFGACTGWPEPGGLLPREALKLPS